MTIEILPNMIVTPMTVMSCPSSMILLQTGGTLFHGSDRFLPFPDDGGQVTGLRAGLCDI